ncbi:hypothetical protein ACIRYZ_17295 [Kitasatospora sp. NPDC101155]|uniref:hypothetical protein n=1 Tax=Kitasatospora sp. NPDC101155 TaxID=3364097 RepID=UPI00380F8753
MSRLHPGAKCGSRSAPPFRRRARQSYPEGSQAVEGSQVVAGSQVVEGSQVVDVSEAAGAAEVIEAIEAASDSASDSQTGSGSPGTVRPSDRHNRASSA